MTSGQLLRKPSGFLPLAMSGVALLMPIVYVAMFGVTRQADEGAAARLWQLLMAAEVPAIGWFALRWAAIEPRGGLPVLVLQLAAAVAAAAPVFLLGF